MRDEAGHNIKYSVSDLDSSSTTCNNDNYTPLVNINNMVLSSVDDFVFVGSPPPGTTPVRPSGVNGSTSSQRQALVLGAGASGLVAAKYLQEDGFKVTIFEKSASIGGVFSHKTYDNTRLVSSTTITAFSDFRFPKKDGLCAYHPTVEEYVSYLEDYAVHFDLHKCICFEAVVTRIERAEVQKKKIEGAPPASGRSEGGEERGGGGGVSDSAGAGGGSTQRGVSDAPVGGAHEEDLHRSTTRNRYTVTSRSKSGGESQQIFDVVAICSGLHEHPSIPSDESIPGLAQFRDSCLEGTALDAVQTVLLSTRTDRTPGGRAAANEPANERTNEPANGGPPPPPNKNLCFHSSQYKTPLIFSKKNVLVLGSGETAMDIALRAVSPQADSGCVGMVCRHGLLSIPHAMTATKPLDTFITNTLEHAHEHPWVHFLRLRWWLSTFVIRGLLAFAGSSWGFNQWCFPVRPVARGWHIVNKSHEAMNHLNGWAKRRYGWWGRFWLWFYCEESLKPIQGFGGGGRGVRRIVARDVSKIVPNSMEGDGPRSAGEQSALSAAPRSSLPRTVFDVEFETPPHSSLTEEDTIFRDVNAIVLCTGYRQKFPFLSDEIRAGLSSRAAAVVCRHAPDEDPLPEEHFIVSPTDVGLGFIGFVRPNVGAIPPMAEVQVQWWLKRMKGETLPIQPHQHLPRTFAPFRRVADCIFPPTSIPPTKMQIADQQHENCPGAAAGGESRDLGLFGSPATLWKRGKDNTMYAVTK